MVGSAFVRQLKKRGEVQVFYPDRTKLNLLDRDKTVQYIRSELYARQGQKVHLINAAAKCGGILDNSSNQYDYLVQNMRIQDNILEGVKAAISGGGVAEIGKILFLGSSCIYPVDAPQPFKEESLGTGAFEPTNEGYALAKMVGIKQANELRKLSEDRLSIVTLNPCNVYGPHDKFGYRGHVIGALIEKFHIAKLSNSKSVTVLGTGRARREFIFVDDLADIGLDLIKVDKLNERLPLGHVNVGCGFDHSIEYVANLIADIVDYKGEIVFDGKGPEGMKSKLLDVSLMASLTSTQFRTFNEGLRLTYDWYKMKRYELEL